ncbi:MAG: hypothetical protein LM590_15840 [Thermofilum sp.]|nr:hypothetical protein [Thermofilum sp.]
MKAVQRVEVVPVSREKLPESLLGKVSEKAGSPLDRLEVYYVPATNDYALGEEWYLPYMD